MTRLQELPQSLLLRNKGRPESILSARIAMASEGKVALKVFPAEIEKLEKEETPPEKIRKILSGKKKWKTTHFIDLHFGLFPDVPSAVRSLRAAGISVKYTATKQHSPRM